MPRVGSWRRLGWAVPVIMLAFERCALITGPEQAASVTLSIRNISVAPSAATLAYDYTIQNVGATVVYLAACSGVVRPDFALLRSDGMHDAISGSACIAILMSTPVPLPPGQRLDGHTSVQRLVGARYAPSVRYTTNAATGAWHSATAPAFVAR